MNVKAPLTYPTRKLVQTISYLVAHRTKTLIAAAITVGVLAILIILLRRNLDTDYLNLLPQQFQSVQGLKALNSDFADSRQIVFGFLGAPGHADDVEAFRSHFMAQLAKEPWVVRIFDRSPLETQDGLDQIQAVIPSLLLNLPEDQFNDALTLLEPAKIEERLAQIRATIGEDFSIRTQMEATMDPLGLFARAMRPFASSSSLTQGESLGSADNLYQLGLAVVRLSDTSPRGCQEMMRLVNGFQRRIEAEWKGYVPKVYTTGRIAFVAQISKSMENDAILSAVLSILIVSVLFFVAFRRFVPLIGICLTLCLAALVALALGMLIFKSINVIAIGFFSILVGLGVDFSLLLFGRYQQARRVGEGHSQAVFVSVRDIGAAVFYVVCTTAIGFFALNFSKSAGFAQLGTLVALGVTMAGLFMVLFLFVFFKKVKPVTKVDFLLIATTKFVHAMFREPRILLGVVTTLLVAGAIVAVTPLVPLRFDTSPLSLQPKKIPASIAMQVMSTELKQESDPVRVLVTADNQQEFYDRWQRLDETFQQGLKTGYLKSAVTPAAFVLNPQRVEENRSLLQKVDFARVKQAVREDLEQNGFALDAFQAVFVLLDNLEAQQKASGLQDWSKIFPENSSWWFLINTFFSDDRRTQSGMLRPAQPIKSHEEQAKLGEFIHRADTQAVITGWQYTLWDLIPWAKGELVTFTTAVGVLILLLLWMVYRRFSLWLIHASALFLSMLGLVACLKLFHLSINLLNTLAFPLVLAIGVDYGIQFLVVSRREGDLRENLANVLKPLSVCGLATFAGFAVLIPAQNPALSGLGMVCALGVLSCLLTTFFFMVPAFALLQKQRPTGRAIERQPSSVVSPPV
ncbi:MAG: MMPL family transporter [Verrucomicrobia bacterium]|nr:MMPL family transporter [Verrucomicrobiota bacterium]